MSQRFDRGEIEVIAIDSGSTDGTVEFLRGAGVRVIGYSERPFRFGPARDFAFRASRGRVIVTQSQDVIPMTDRYVDDLVSPILEGDADIVQGNTGPGDQPHFYWHAKRSAFYFTSEGTRFTEEFGGIALSFECIAIERSAWKESGFANALVCEDKVFQRLAVTRGRKIIRLAGAIATHDHAYSTRGLIARCVQEGRGWAEAEVTYTLRQAAWDSIRAVRWFDRWFHALIRLRLRSFGELFFFQIRPIAVWSGNRSQRRRRAEG